MSARCHRGTRVYAHAIVGLLTLAAAARVGASPADAAQDGLALRSLAATCAACHGTDGRAAPGESLPALAGRDRAELAGLLRAFRDGARPATVMHQLAKGYTLEQIDALAAYFAAQTADRTP